MKALILAAGFGTRLEESMRQYRGPYHDQLTQWIGEKPKGLVLIRDRPVLSYQLEQLVQAGIEKKDIFIHTNGKYYSFYYGWATAAGIPGKNVFNNLTYTHETRLGAVGDLFSALRRISLDTVIVMASDTLIFNKGKLFDLRDAMQVYRQDSLARIVVYPGEPQKLSRHGIVQVDAHDAVIGFEEKPLRPKSNLVNASVHLYTPGIIEAIISSPLDFRAEAGMLIQYLYPLFTIKVARAEKRIDIGTVEEVIKANMQGVP